MILMFTTFRIFLEPLWKYIDQKMPFDNGLR